MDRFYNDLPPFTDFSGVADMVAYEPVPDDWFILATDIQGSTRAIQAGRYKDVNMLGAASITAVLNTCSDTDVPYVFGGDGATILVPPSIVDAATEALVRLRQVSQRVFRMTLRVGVIPVADVHKDGYRIGVRKYQLSDGNYLAMFSGGGMEYADRLLKAEDSLRYLPSDAADTAPPDLDGISCRWNPLTPHGGKVVAIMVRSLHPGKSDNDTPIEDMLAAISSILGTPVEDAAPANPWSMRFRWPPAGLGIEARATVGEKNFFKHYLGLLYTSFVQFLCERFDLFLGDYDGRVYRTEVRSNTDFRKFDGILRLVLDVTPEHAAAIEAYLESEYQAGRLVYGFHAANTAMMTCLLFSLPQSEHVHFVDAGDGGYALASIGFKQRLAAIAPK
ncbi:MAG TPA: DUF3095 domain-containing protein [Pseudomonadales bacterium]|nr:DUF3095 domain-containing protein [Pseudomonadales bacterium]